MRMEPRTEVSDAQRSVPSHETVGQPASSSTSQFWGPGQIVDPNLSGEGGGVSAASAPKILGWTYAPKHVLPRWGRGGDDLAAVGLAEALEFDVLVTSSGACVKCGSTRHVRVQRWRLRRLRVDPRPRHRLAVDVLRAARELLPRPAVRAGGVARDGVRRGAAVHGVLRVPVRAADRGAEGAGGGHVTAAREAVAALPSLRKA